MSQIKFKGTGPGKQTQDGCSVEFYRLLKPQGEPELIASAVPEHGTILELGCGVGRVTHPLVDLGFTLTAVDNSAEMLAYVKGAETICTDIENLDLSKKFDAVLLMSHMINIPDMTVRSALLKTCYRHLKWSGSMILQCHPADLIQKIKVGHVGMADGIETYVDKLEVEGNLAELTLRWQHHLGTWTQSFETEILNLSQIEQSLEIAGLKFKKWLDSESTIFIACHVDHSTFCHDYD
ncbi:MAG: class I SAM-dependent methyltransferase [Chloroflexota bacterium]